MVTVKMLSFYRFMVNIYVKTHPRVVEFDNRDSVSVEGHMSMHLNGRIQFMMEISK